MTRRARRILWGMGTGLLLVIGALIVMGRLAGFGCAGRSPDPIAAPLSADALEGDWSGTWASSSRDMGGALRCHIQKIDEQTYQAHFDAVFAKVLNHTSNVTLKARRAGQSWTFSGEQDLGFLNGGIYKYIGRSDGREFTCNYDSYYDKGTFHMTRAAPTTSPADR